MISDYKKNLINFEGSKLNNGFTLIELITVMSIMVIILSLVGPLTIKFIDKAQAQSEFITLKNSLKKVSYLSFASATPQMLTFENKQLIISKPNTENKKFTFKFLTFSPQKISFNSRGYTSPEVLTLSFLNDKQDINLFKLIEGEDAKIN